MNKKEFNKILKKLRLEKGMTQFELAEKADINEKYYGRIERGESIPTMSIFFKLCIALDIKGSQFIQIMEKNN